MRMSDSSRSSIGRWIGVALAILATVIPGAAFAQALVPNGCKDDLGSPFECGLTNQNNGLGDVYDVTVSPSGDSVYAVGLADDSIVIYDRDKSGALTFKTCIDDDDTMAGSCPTHARGLDDARSVAVSPLGNSVYVVSAEDDALIWFRRYSDGSLQFQSCWQDDDAAAPDDCTVVHGLNGARQVTVSPDGANVYVASYDDDAVAVFARAPGGALAYGQCFVDDDQALPTECGFNGNNRVKGLGHAHSVQVTPDGYSVYVAGASAHAIVMFDRSTVNGALTPKGCFNDSDNHPDNCFDPVNNTPRVAQGLKGARSIAVSDDYVYVAGYEDDAIAMFSRVPIATMLTPFGCTADDLSATDCGNDAWETAHALDGVHSIALGANGDLYAASRLSSAVVRFSRDASGVLDDQECVSDVNIGQAGCASMQGLGGAHAVTSYGALGSTSTVYVASRTDSSIARLDVDNTP
jgi:6-phosphogluconolactonase (cycloisomerase 2 family)